MLCRTKYFVGKIHMYTYVGGRGLVQVLNVSGPIFIRVGLQITGINLEECDR